MKLNTQEKRKIIPGDEKKDSASFLKQNYKNKAAFQKKNNPQKKPSLLSSLSKQPTCKKEAQNKNPKKQLRDAKRLLMQKNLDASVRVETERRIKALELQLVEKIQDIKAIKTSRRYKMVKFFEQKKALRAIHQIEQKLEDADEDDKHSIELELMEANIDLNYILHFPAHEKYISLFVDHGNALPDKVIAKKQAIRENIKTLMLEGKLSDNPKDSSACKNFSKLKSTGTSAPEDIAQGSSVKVEDDFFAAADDSEESCGETESSKE
ncbi:18S rRNA maturation protein [Entomophthora muscae]|uniref:18S rRNA maturation protein n=1 Tax=Entomophthora muscae TaxID=34485 RepID=A0ACC2S1J6_9FUNG|nr:18S rRNA maturation protein [Entomophthora muscae]